MSDTKTRKAKNNKKPAKNKLTLKQQAFIDNYINPDSPTYSNGKQSVIQAYGYDNPNSASVTASNLLTNTKVLSEMDRLLDELNMGAKVRLQSINSIMTGKHTQKTTTTTTDAEGKKYRAVTVKAPTASDVLKSIDLLARIDGTYDKNKVKADLVSTELKGLIKKHREELTPKQGKRVRGK